jgi:resuscitation-promoting factor RpfA
VASGEPESDVAAGLSELECKLRELERAFSTLGHEYDGRPSEPPPQDHLSPAQPVTGATPPPVAPEPQSSSIDDLARRQEHLSATLESLQADVSRLVEGLAKPPPAAPAAAVPPAPAPLAPRPAPVHPLPVQRVQEPEPPAEPRSIRDYVPKPPATPAPADDDT